MSLKLRIFSSFILVAIVGMVAGIMGIISFSKITDTNEQLSKQAKLRNNTQFVLDAHFKWRHTLTQAVMTESEFTGSLDSKTCALGNWLNSDEVKNMKDKKINDLINEVKPKHDFIHTSAKDVVAFIEEGDAADAQSYLIEQLLPETQAVIDGLEKMAERANELYEDCQKEIESTAEFYSRLMYIMVAVVVIAAIIMALFITNWISGKVYWYESVLDSIQFPISVTDNKRNWTFINKSVEDMLNLKRSDVMGKQCSNWGAGICNTDNCGINCLERGKLQTNFEQMGMDFQVDTSYLQDKRNRRIGHIEVVQDVSAIMQAQKAEAKIVGDIASISQSFIDASRQVAEGAQSLASGSTQQAATLEELSASISDIADKTAQNAGRTNSASDLADSIMRNAEKGTMQMESMITAVNQINAANQNISKVIKTIDDIAFQTNILALNASVEAARAGAAGKGFAVVAEEVRNLAAKSAESANETSELVSDSIEKAQLGTQIAGETAASLAEIVSGINESNKIIAEIASSSEEQTGAIDQINIGINGVTQVVQQNSATAEESAAASEEMSGQANTLEELVRQFKLKS